MPKEKEKLVFELEGDAAGFNLELEGDASGSKLEIESCDAEGPVDE